MCDVCDICLLCDGASGQYYEDEVDLDEDEQEVAFTGLYFY